jgi:hypothetical protein
MILTLGDDVLTHLLGYLSDGETIVRCALSCKRIWVLVMTTETTGNGENQVWKHLDRALAARIGRPEISNGAARDRVCRFAAASLFAQKMEALAFEHHYSLLEDSCPGCNCFPDTPDHTGFKEFVNVQSKGKSKGHTRHDQITSTFFVRLSVDERMIWEGFLVGSLSDREIIHLRLPQREDLRPALESWTDLQKLLREYPDFHHSFEPYYGNGLFQNSLLTFPSLYDGAASFNARIKACHDECMKNLTCTIVAVGTNLNDRRLLITTYGLDKDAMALAGYCQQVGSFFPTTLAPMPVLAHGVPPDRPWDKENIKYFRTSAERPDKMGDTVQCWIDFSLASSKTITGKVEGFSIRYMHAFEFCD